MANRGGVAATAKMAEKKAAKAEMQPADDDIAADGSQSEEPAYSALPMPVWGKLLGPVGTAWHDASVKLLNITYGDKCSNFILGVIILAGVLVGVQTYPGMEDDPVVKAIDMCVLVVFILELLAKFFSEGLRPYRMFFGPNWAWNWFDLIIVVMCLPGVPVSGYAAALRLARLARLLKLVNKIPQLKLIISGLVGGLRAIFYIMLLLCMVFYFYAILGMSCFMQNDPWHWGHFGYAMETLFRMATLEDWTEIMCKFLFPSNSHYLIFCLRGKSWEFTRSDLASRLLTSDCVIPQILLFLLQTSIITAATSTMPRSTRLSSA